MDRRHFLRNSALGSVAAAGLAAPAIAQQAPKLRWLARGYLAEARCRMGERERAQRDLDALAAELRSAQPDGGVIPREIAALRAACR
jgi:hypothetical protein